MIEVLKGNHIKKNFRIHIQTYLNHSYSSSKTLL